MPFEIIRNDITNIQADAIVNTANPHPVIGSGVDSEIHQKAGASLLLARQKIGDIFPGDAAITPAFQLQAKYVIHTVSPIWQGGTKNEAALLESCYQKSLQLALKRRCKSIAFPLLASGNNGFPKELSLQTAIRVFSQFLLEHDMLIYLVVYDRSAFLLSEKLFQSVKSFIDDTYIDEKKPAFSIMENSNRREMPDLCYMAPEILTPESLAPVSKSKPAFRKFLKLDDMMNELTETFSESLIRIIDQKGLKDSEVYKKANIDRKLFSKIKNNANYKPGKSTAIAFAIALELNLDETKDLIGRAGYALTHSSKFDVIIEYFICEKNYNIFEINEVLFAFDQPLIGS